MADETPRDDEPTAGLPGEPADAPGEPEDATPAQTPIEEPAPEATVGDETTEPVAEEPAPEAAADAPAAEETPVTEEPPVAEEQQGFEDEEPAAPREKPAIPGADLEVDIVFEGVDPLARGDVEGFEDEEQVEGGADEEADQVADQPIAQATIDLAAGARYRATGKRKTAVARVILKPGDGTYTVNGKPLDVFFPRSTLQRNIRQPLEAVGYDDRMDVIARMHGGGVSSQAGALRHGISRALLEADPNLRGELKRRGFLTRDARAKERKKAGLKKARKRPQFSKR